MLYIWYIYICVYGIYIQHFFVFNHWVNIAAAWVFNDCQELTFSRFSFPISSFFRHRKVCIQTMKLDFDLKQQSQKLLQQINTNTCVRVCRAHFIKRAYVEQLLNALTSRNHYLSAGAINSPQQLPAPTKAQCKCSNRHAADGCRWHHCWQEAWAACFQRFLWTHAYILNFYMLIICKTISRL